MKVNVGKTDRLLRIIAGLLIAAAGIYYHSWWGLLGIIPLGTALSGLCLLYAPFGISTCKAKPEKQQ